MKPELPRTGDVPLDVLVVGAGPAGLTAAMYLARYRRHVRVLHDGTSRALWIPRSRNIPAFPDGITGPDLVERLSDHALRYGAEILEGRVASISSKPTRGGFRAQLESGAEIEASGIILATGVETNLAKLDAGDHRQAVRAGVLRYCPICDGYEHSHERIAVLGSDLHGAAEAMFLRQYSSDITLIPQWGVALTDAQRAELRASGVKIVEGRVSHLEATDAAMLVTIEGEAEPRRFDILYPAFGSTPRSELAAMLGSHADANGCLPVSAYLEGLVPGGICRRRCDRRSRPD